MMSAATATIRCVIESVEQIIGERVKQLRERRHRPQTWVAHAMTQLGFRWSRHTVIRTETGRRDLTIREAVALALCLQTDVADLLEPLRIRAR